MSFFFVPPEGGGCGSSAWSGILTRPVHPFGRGFSQACNPGNGMCIDDPCGQVTCPEGLECWPCREAGIRLVEVAGEHRGLREHRTLGRIEEIPRALQSSPERSVSIAAGGPGTVPRISSGLRGTP